MENELINLLTPGNKENEPESHLSRINQAIRLLAFYIVTLGAVQLCHEYY